jgi:hypothetical protein
MRIADMKKLKESKLRELRQLLRKSPHFEDTRREFLAYINGFRRMDSARARYRRFTHLSVTQTYGTGSPTKEYPDLLGAPLKFRVAGCVYTLFGDYIEGVKFYKRLARLPADRFVPTGAEDLI